MGDDFLVVEEDVQVNGSWTFIDQFSSPKLNLDGLKSVKECQRAERSFYL